MPIIFINGEQNNDDPDYEVYEQGDGDWNNLQAFRTYEEANNYRDNLIKDYTKCDDKDNWYPKF